MKQLLTEVAQAYLEALREHLRLGSHLSLQSALGLGCRAAALGLQPLELVEVHKQALAKLKPPASSGLSIKRARRFLKDALIPLVKMDHAGSQGKLRMNRLNLSLDHRTAQLSETKTKLREGLAKRESLELELRNNTSLCATLLRESLEIQDDLRKLTRRAFTTHEKERRRLSRELANRIAQTLLGVNVSLIVLRQEAEKKVKGLKEQIAHTHRVVASSVQSVRQVARKYRHT